MVFWVKFAIEEALNLAGVFIQSADLTDARKVAIQKFIDASNELLNAF